MKIFDQFELIYLQGEIYNPKYGFVSFVKNSVIV